MLKLYYWVKSYVLKDSNAFIRVWKPYETPWPEGEGTMIFWNVQSYLSSDTVTSQKAWIFRLIIKATTFSVFLKKKKTFMAAWNYIMVFVCNSSDFLEMYELWNLSSESVWDGLLKV